MTRSAMTMWAVGVWLVAATAAADGRAQLRACGDINIDAQAECQLEAPSVQCMARCDIDSFTAACSARVSVQCDGDCVAELDAECTGSCQADCMARCTDFEPGEFDCHGDCDVSCDGHCEAQCEDSECMAACQGQCHASCEADCDVMPPSADCDAQCEASCSGSCNVEANLDCQLDCRGEASAQCEVDLKADCEAGCTGDKGSLFCDGQFVDDGGNLAECRAALRALLDIEVMASGSADASCGGGSCEAMAEGMVSASSDCSVRPGSTPTAPTWLAFSALLGGLFARRCRRRTWA